MLYPVGMLIYMYKDRVENLFENKKLLYYISFASCFIMLVVFIKFANNPLCDIIKNIFFGLIIVLLTMKVGINNKILVFFGKNLFSLYIFHRLVMIVLTYVGLNKNPLLYVVLVIAITSLLTIPFNYLFAFTDKLLFGSLSKKSTDK